MATARSQASLAVVLTLISVAAPASPKGRASQTSLTTSLQYASSLREAALLQKTGTPASLRRAVDAVWPHWVGTPWTFEGHTARPRVGTVACGYFVSTVLRDTGLVLNRYRLAQQTPERIVRSLASPSDVVVFENQAPEEISRDLRARGGLWVIGLSGYHVGLARVDDGQVEFCHSNYLQPDRGVMCEPVTTSAAWSDARTVYAGQLDTAWLAHHWRHRKRVTVLAAGD